MNKVYIRDFYPPIDRVIYGLIAFNFTVAFLFPSTRPQGWSLWIAVVIIIFAFAKLLSTFHVESIVSSYISADKNGVQIKRFLKGTTEYQWEEIENVVLQFNKMRLTVRGKKTQIYLSTLNDNHVQLKQLIQNSVPTSLEPKII